MESTPKILFVCPLPPPVHGSAMVSQYIKDSELLKDEFDMDFVNLSTSRSMAEIGKKSYSLYAKKTVRFMAAYAKTFWKLLTKRYDLCYLAITCHGVGFLKDMPFVLLCKLFGRKVVIHQHNKGMSADVDKVPYKWLMPFTYKNTKVILLSWRLYPDIQKNVNKDQILICPNGIPSLETESNVNNFKRNNAIPRLLYLSNLIPSKGVYVLLDACKILKDKGIVFTCDFVGGESKEISREVFETAVHERGLDEKVHYHGPKYGSDKESYWNNADVFVFPTYDETFGLVALEAMQHCLPVVATDEGGVPDVVEGGTTGFICKRKDAADLANKLERIISDCTIWHKLGQSGRERYEQYFTLKCFEHRILECLKSCIE